MVIKNQPPTVRRRGRTGKMEEWSNLAISFDIETSYYDVKPPVHTRMGMTPPERWSWMYTWRIAVEDEIIRGGTWAEAERAFREIIDAADGERLVCYVHNLPYEFAFMEGVFTPEDVFAKGAHHVLKAVFSEFPAIEWRCSYAATGKSLAVLGDELGLPKMVGDLDYTVRRYAGDKLTAKESGYCDRDVQVVVAWVRRERSRYGSVVSIPLTKTGVIRREVRKVCASEPTWGLYWRQSRLDDEMYQFHRRARWGGDTHPAGWAVGTVQEAECYDLNSSYPSQNIYFMYPRGRPRWAKDPAKMFAKLRRRDDTRYIAEVVYTGLTVRGIDPCLMSHHCAAEGAEIDCGRIVKADRVVVTLTDCDVRSVDRMYTIAEAECARLLYYPRAERLPKCFRDCEMKYYAEKNRLKAIPDKTPEMIDEYRRRKEGVNSFWGMAATEIVRPSWRYDRGGWSPVSEGGIEKYNREGFLPYQIGIWTPAAARERLIKALEVVGADAIYWDTDSCKCLPGHAADFRRLNKDIRAEAAGCGYRRAELATADGTILGEWAREHDCRIKTMGSKKYATEDADGFGITIAGVSKRAREYVEDHGGFDALQYGFVFPADISGRTVSQYRYEPGKKIVTPEGRAVEVSSCVSIVPCEYTLGATDDYLALLWIAYGNEWAQINIERSAIT